MSQDAKRKIVLYNPIAGNGESRGAVDALAEKIGGEVADICAISDYGAFISSLGNDCEIIICGGDGTLNFFANAIKNIEIANDIYYFPTGTGNDFARDIGFEHFTEPTYRINDYIKNLPSVTVDGRTELFINNVGFGIDGYCCVVGDAMREENRKNGTNKSIDYTMIAIKGLLFHFKPRGARVTVDGKEYTYKNVWIAPTMNGRYYGGGMMATPAQDRLSPDGKVSLMLYHSVGKIRALMAFPSIFKGEHIKRTDMVTVLTGDSITVEFDRPTPLQIDGEVIEGVRRYSVQSSAMARKSGEARAESAV
jgi:diacylglycerol kinase family enzyme